MSVGVRFDLTGSTSRTLLKRVQQHEPAAWERFVKLYGPLVYGWCRSSQLNATDARDVSQDVFAAVFTAIGKFRHDRPGDTLRGWLRIICRNKLNDFFRTRAGAAQARGGSDDLLQRQPFAELDDGDESSVATERHLLIRRAAELVAAEVEPRSWQAFWMLAVESKSVAEVAEKLGLSPGAVRQAKYRILQRLREELHGELDRPDPA